MQTFGELLREYMTRIGISDVEMARTLGVSRQTIFRWKEGLVEKPRYRDDVLKIATKLRLAPDERDTFLLSAGFAPEAKIESAPVETKSEPAPIVPPIETPSEPASVEIKIEPPPKKFNPRVIGVAMSALVTLFALVAAFAVWQASDTAPQIVAAPGETLIIVGAFDDTQPTTPDSRQRVLPTDERIQAAIEREVLASRLERVRIALWREPIRDTDAILRRSNAQVVIGGTRTNANLNLLIAFAPTTRADDMPLDALVAAPSKLNWQLAVASPDDVQALALLVVSQVHIARGQWGLARASLSLAQSRADAPALNLQAGYIAQLDSPPDLFEAIPAYTRVISATQDGREAYLNRGVAFVRLNDARWQSDFARALQLKANDANTRLALCWAYALDQKPDAAMPYCDASERAREARALVLAEQGKFSEAANDLQSVVDWLARQPENLRARYGTSRSEWLQMLRAGKNPFTPDVLEKLRRE